MKHAARMVWHVARFAQLVELPDDTRFCRRGPLLYCRDFVSANDDESAAYLRQIDALSRRQNGLELEGAWSRIRRAASGWSRAYRGYLLSADHRPLNVAEIGRTILFCDPRRATRILKSLEEVGLLEQVRCPIFDESENGVPSKKRRRTPGNKAKRQSAESGVGKSISRESSRKSERARAPLRAKGKRKRKRNTESGRGKEEKAGIRNPESARPRESQGQVLEGPCPPTAPEVRSPRNPQEPATGSAVAPQAPAPRASFRGGEPQRLGPIIRQRFDHWLDEEAVRFGQNVFTTIWPGEDPDSEWATGERGVFTKWLASKGAAGSRQAAIDKGLKVARHIAKHRKTYRKPGAVWRQIVDGKANSPAAAAAQRAVA
jgi:hypothetical protein